MIHFKNVSKYFHDKAVIDKINMEIKDGEFIVLLGESGCGKTTTLKMINKLIYPSDGVIKINGEDISKLDTIELRRKMGYVIQQTGLFPHMTIEENISLIAKLNSNNHKEISDNARRLMAMVNLDPEIY